MPLGHQNDFGILLDRLAESLDISENQFEMATKHYKSVGEWLNEPDSSIAIHAPDIYLQGSFRLGTVIKPINDADEYDIDLVCELKKLPKKNVTQKQLKQMVGNRLRENERYWKMIEEGNRCWRLNYSDSVRFHMDILPGIPDNDIHELTGLIGANLAAGTILITDKELHEWQRSNPSGYAEWFKERMKVQYNTKRLQLAESLRSSVEQVPDYKVKTPLQRAVQLLKRHRDIMFAEDQDDRPISIIISTVAAWSYNDESNLLDAMTNILDGMPRHIERRNGVSWIPNPVNPLENFADKWRKHPQREAKFRQWLQEVRSGLDAALRKSDILQMAEGLKPRFGDRIINQVMAKTFPTKSTIAVASVGPHIKIASPSKPWRP
jgi:hypothetical protein